MAQQDENLQNIRHTLAHLLACAVQEIYPSALPAIGPATENGFYYDFDFTKGNIKISSDDLPAIEAKMRQILPYWEQITGREISEKSVTVAFNHNPYKTELIQEIIERKEPLTIYTARSISNTTDKENKYPFADLCRGGHVKHPNGEIKENSFALSHTSGAYWRGSEKNPMLTRIYGLAFSTREELDEYLKMQEQAKKRDHKKLGIELDLFTFSDMVGPGLPLWTPKGTILRGLLDDFVWSLREKHGYEKVEIPHITKKDLYQKSGHWEKFKDELLKIKTREGHKFAMKPMNCPHHTQIYTRKQWSYRELPQRYANTTACYRDEQTGELSGLSRVRAFTQDDAHVFCRAVDVAQEFATIWDIIDEFYSACNFVLYPRLSLHDPAKPEQYLGDKELWHKAEQELRSIAKSRNFDAKEAPGEAAFYGPKIDFMAKDSLGREWQLATIQLDMNLPERFDLYCINEKAQKERIVMIHGAIMGSIERYLSILIEHFAGAFPVWLSPVQVKILPIGETHRAWAREVHGAFTTAKIRANLDQGDETLGKRIRIAKQEKIPYIVVIGNKEITQKNISLESRNSGSLGQQNINDTIAKICLESTSRA